MSTARDPIATTDPIVVFDGVCHLCSAWVRFLLGRKGARRYRYAAMQSDSGRRLLAQHGLGPDDPVSFLLLRDGIAYTDTDAILRVLHDLGGFWRASVALRVVPAILRDPVYRWIARNRYRLFGRRDTCWLPDPRFTGRFL